MKTDFTGLTGDSLRGYYRELKALQRGVEPSEIKIPERDDSFFQRSLSRASNSFVTGGDLRDRTAATDPTKLETPLEQFQKRLKSVLDRAEAGTEIPAEELLLVEQTAKSIYGFPIDTSDGKVSEKDKVQLLELHALLDSGKAPDVIAARGAFNTEAAASAAAAAEAQRLRDIATAKAAEIEAKQDIYTIESGAAVLGYGSVDGKLNTIAETSLGKPGHELDQILIDHADQLQRHYGKNIFEIRNGMITPDGNGGVILSAKANGVMEYLVQNTDISAKITELAGSTDPNDIRQLQGILRLSKVDGADKIQTTGEMDYKTMTATIELLEQERGMGNTTLAFTKAPVGSKLGYNVATSVVLDKLEKGTLEDPTKMSDEDIAKLPREVREELVQLREDIKGLDPIDQREEIANFLSKEENYIAYDAYLKGRTVDPELMAKLKAQLPELKEAADKLAARTELGTDFSNTVMSTTLAETHFTGSRAEIEAQLEKIEALRAAGDMEGVAQAEIGLARSEMARIEKEQITLAEPHIERLRKIPGLEDITAKELVDKLNSPEGIQGSEFEMMLRMKDNYMNQRLYSGKMRRLTGDHRTHEQFIERATATPEPAVTRGIVKAEPVAVEPAEVVSRAAIPPQDRNPGGARSTRELVAESAHRPEFMRVVGNEVTNTIYQGLPAQDIYRDRNAPPELRDLAKMKLAADRAQTSLDDGTYTGSPASIKGDISRAHSQFETKLEALRSSGNLPAIQKYMQDKGIDLDIPKADPVKFETPAAETGNWWSRNITPLFGGDDAGTPARVDPAISPHLREGLGPT